METPASKSALEQATESGQRTTPDTSPGRRSSISRFSRAAILATLVGGASLAATACSAEFTAAESSDSGSDAKNEAGAGGSAGTGGKAGAGGSDAGTDANDGGSDVCVPSAETCDGVDNDCDQDIDNGCSQITLENDDCYKAALIVDGQVVDGTADNTSCSSGSFAATWAPGELLQIWENDGNLSYKSPKSASLVEWRCSPSNNPPDWNESLSQSTLGNYQSVEPIVAGNDYALALSGCTRYLIRMTK